LALYDFSAPRLFVDVPLAAGAVVPLERAQANYLLNVLRLKSGEAVLVFNGRDGEWRAQIGSEGRKSAELRMADCVRSQTPAPDLHYLFAPLKHARLDYMVQKAVELGTGTLKPVFTTRTQASRVNLDRMRSNAIEAAEQCGILNLPEILEAEDLAPALRALDGDRLLVFCDEDAELANPVEALAAAREGSSALALLIGPEGGFTDEERRLILARERVVRLSLGPRILRADTAAVAALALVQSVLGDWR
jgi:16S rRNA (uracil1498-N3)-methyltransferase